MVSMAEPNRITVVHALRRRDIRPGEIGLVGTPLVVVDGDGQRYRYEIGALIRGRGDFDTDDCANDINHANVMRMAVHVLGLYPDDCEPRAWAERFLWESGARPYLVLPSRPGAALRLDRQQIPMNVSEWQPARRVREDSP